MESEIFTARVDDTADIAERTSKCKYLGFLTPEQAVAAEKRLKNRSVRFGFFGGYDGAERVMLGCFPEWVVEEEYPITAVTFHYRKADSLSHRDFLGSLMALGIKRESVGDILVGSGKTVVFMSSDIAGYVMTQIEKIGRTGVDLSIGTDGALPERARLEELSITVASFRLDGVVAALCGISRNKAVEKITQSQVAVNSFVCEKVTLNVNEGDIISVRGKGKFIIGSSDGRSRKNRVILEYKKYI